MTNTMHSVVDTYIAAWHEPDADRRRELVGAAWTSDAPAVDPLMSGAGVAEIRALIGAAQAQFPGHLFELASGPDAHNDVARFPWSLVGAGGPVAAGTDFAVAAGDGRLRSVTGFL